MHGIFTEVENTRGQHRIRAAFFYAVDQVLQIAHTAATPVGLTVTLETEIVAVDGRLVSFAFTAHDGIEAAGGGRHTRTIVARERFAQRLAEKRARVACPDRAG